jgi:hypothetical protein
MEVSFQPTSSLSMGLLLTSHMEQKSCFLGHSFNVDLLASSNLMVVVVVALNPYAGITT